MEHVCTHRTVPAPAMRRTVVAVLRYLLRARTRATPFGLFAGVAAVRIGTEPALRVGTGHLVAARADAAHSTVLIDRFEQHPALRPRLMLLASNILIERDGYVVIEHRPSGTFDRRPNQVQVRLTAPVREALGGARTPVLWSDLAGKLSISFPSAPPSVIDRLIADLVRQRVLLTSLRPAMTVSDPLNTLVEQAAHLPPTEAAEIRSTPRSVLDLRVDWD
ncbi:lantibiotic dehydratase [Streptomyces sp. NPDC047461]|uniref:lantibiotic dehydratase n=1 Tax=Streptomyces sp. NPDC047461 TaxID=3155619 RepID=UPI0033C27F3E